MSVLAARRLISSKWMMIGFGLSEGPSLLSKPSADPNPSMIFWSDLICLNKSLAALFPAELRVAATLTDYNSIKARFRRSAVQADVR